MSETDVSNHEDVESTPVSPDAPNEPETTVEKPADTDQPDPWIDNTSTKTEQNQTKLPSFDFTMEQKKLLDIINLIATVSDEVAFTINSEGIRTRAMDPGRVAMIDLNMPKQAFDEYAYDEAEDSKIAVNLTELIKVLRRFKHSDKMTVESLPASAKLRVDSGLSQFELPTLDVSEEDELPAPKVNFTTSFKIVTDAFKKAVEDSAVAASHVVVTATQDSVVFEAKGDFLKARNEFKRGCDALLNLEGGEARAVYSLKYLVDIAKAIPVDALRFSFVTDMPFKIEVEGDVKLLIFLAPRIEVE